MWTPHFLQSNRWACNCPTASSFDMRNAGNTVFSTLVIRSGFREPIRTSYSWVQSCSGPIGLVRIQSSFTTPKLRLMMILQSIYQISCNWFRPISSYHRLTDDDSSIHLPILMQLIPSNQFLPSIDSYLSDPIDPSNRCSPFAHHYRPHELIICNTKNLPKIVCERAKVMEGPLG